ncbi:hypothetical protein C0989_009425 [Termitomyces sp. Mn162]|nr:hypothetical protein C0989_009425 [Termitomyces sp. Mn162]
MKSLAPPQQSYPPLPPSKNASSSSSSRLECPVAAPTKDKGKGKATATSPSALAKESNFSLSTDWKTVKQHFSAKEKGKDKGKEPKASTSSDEQIAHLLQWLHDAGVPEEVGANVLENSVVQLTLFQVQNQLGTVRNQNNKAQSDLF